MTAPQVTDRLPIYLRAYAVPDGARKGNPNSSYRGEIDASDWCLILDNETTADERQSLRFGAYQIRQAGALMEGGLFYSSDNLSDGEISILRDHAEERGLEFLTQSQFVEHIFFRIGYDFRGTVIGFNLPFDLARIAISADSARGRMKGGFTFRLSPDKRRPNLQIKHLSSKAAFIQFAAPMKSRTNRSRVKRGLKEPIQRGHFVDCKTLANALFAKPYSLKTLSEDLKVANAKLDFEDFNAPITPEFIDYALRDVQATWECYSVLIDKFNALALDGAKPEKIFSEASLGKACLKAMGIKPWRDCQPDFDPQIIGSIMSSYFGGRSEIGIRREERQVLLCDFLSMYPTVCTLMKLWQYVIANGVEATEATTQAKEVLQSVTLADLQTKAFWPQLTMLVRVSPDADIFPVRAKYADALQSTIGLNFYTSDTPQWFTLADCIASKLLTGKVPKVVEALQFAPRGRQANLKSIEVCGEPDYAIDPTTDDFYKRLIELRQATKARRDSSKGASFAALDTQQNAHKIMANATSYGIFVEQNVEDAKADTMAEIFAGQDCSFDASPSKVEKPGTYFHPLLATLITGAARLMLAITEKLASQQGLEWAFCDTDSMALAKPHWMRESSFHQRVQGIIDWFANLNPYHFGGSILQSEKVNKSLAENRTLEPLYCLAISAKRYALYNLDANRRPILRKASAHGLGHLRAPYSEPNLSRSIPSPRESLSKIGVTLWQHDLWFKIIEAARSSKPRQVDFSYHPALLFPAISRYSASSPEMLRWFKQHNEGKSYNNQIKPFGFLTGLFADFLDCEEHPPSRKKGRKPKQHNIAPIAPFGTDPVKAASMAFDRNDGSSISISKLKTVAQTLAQYHLQPENKFLNGDYCGSGKTSRRHVRASCISHIGKEANDWERQASLGYDASAQPAYGLSPRDIAQLQAELSRLCGVFSSHQISTYGRITAKRLKGLIEADATSGFTAHDAAVIESLTRYFLQKEMKFRDELNSLDQLISTCGLRKVARDLGTDPSNLRRKIEAQRVKVWPIPS